MKPISLIASGALALVCACEVPAQRGAVIIDRGRVLEVRSSSRVPATLLQQASLEIDAHDQVLNRGYRVDPSEEIRAGGPLYLQIRRSVPIVVNGDPQQSTASTVGEALAQAGIEARLADQVEPSVGSPIHAGLIIQHRPAGTVAVTVDGQILQIGASTEEAGSDLAEAGLPMIGLDVLIPQESGGTVQGEGVGISRIREVVTLVQDPIPFGNQVQDSDVLELGIEQVLHPGQPGLSMTRTRTKLQDGVEVSRTGVTNVVVRPPQDRTVVRGTKIVEKSATVDGVSLSYWHSMQMYATVYSPCNSATPDGSCSTGTASGRRAGKGVVAVDPGLYAVLNGQRLYIPGYGYGVIGDVGGGYLVEQNLGISRYKWIDLGFDDDNIQDMSGWITVYFLSPAPAAIPDVLK